MRWAANLAPRLHPKAAPLQAATCCRPAMLFLKVFNENMSPWLTQDMAGAGLNVTAIEAANENQTNAAAFEVSAQ